MELLPEPLTPMGCDLRDFAFMPLDVARLRDSDLAATESPESCWAAVLLWSASWHQVPAASLPDDDRVLSNLSGYGRVVKEWQRVKEGALRGWVKCRDGRLYHPVVAEKACESWDSKQRHGYGKMSERLRKLNKQRSENQLKTISQPDFDQWISGGKIDPIPPEFQKPDAGIPKEQIKTSAGKNKSSAGIPLEKPLKGEGQGQGQGQGHELLPKHTAATGDVVGDKTSVCVLDDPKVFDGLGDVLPPIPDEPVDPDPPDPQFVPSMPAAICLAMKAAGIAAVSPSHADLPILLAGGADIGMFVAAARIAVDGQKGFNYAIGIVKSQLLSAKTLADQIGRMPPATGNRSPTVIASPGKHTGFQNLDYKAGINNDGSFD